MFKITQKVLILFLVAGLCVFAGSAGAQSLCPYVTDLVVNSDDIVETWEEVGTVSINDDICNNDDNKLYINLNTTNGRFIKKVAIYINNNDDFEAILDKKNQPKVKYFPDDLVEEFKSPVTTYGIEIDLSELDIYIHCNDYLYIVVGVEMNGIEGMLFAENGGEFDREDPPDDGFWGYYVTYKIEECLTVE